MKKFLQAGCILFVVVLLGGWPYVKSANECRKAYTIGYYAGFSAKICNLGFDYDSKSIDRKFKYVGVGNEDYNIYPYQPNMAGDLNRRRGKKFWWAE